MMYLLLVYRNEYEKPKPTHSCKANWKNSGSSNLNYVMSDG